MRRGVVKSSLIFGLPSTLFLDLDGKGGPRGRLHYCSPRSDEEEVPDER